jgi:hypothetical protein
MTLNDLVTVFDEFSRTGRKLAFPAQGIVLKWPHLLLIHFIDFSLIFIGKTLISKLVKDVIIKFLV